tara:strand:- start:72 stop:617 length:546 start_codon:yes stop_codon:yes gene_type:complete
MNSESRVNLINNLKNYILILTIPILISILLIFKNIFFESTLLLKSLGNSSIDPELAFINKKPTFFEFYADWCEICKEMAPKINNLKTEYGDQINFVFLNVDNPKWNKYIQNFDVNGIPHINLFNSNAELEATFVGLQDEDLIKNSLKSITRKEKNHISVVSRNSSKINDIQKNKVSPRSHG